MSLRSLLDSTAKKYFRKGGRFERFFPLFEAVDTILYSTGKTTKVASHIRDSLDLKRLMMLVVIAVIPCTLMAIYNTGYQAALAISRGAAPLGDWQTTAMKMMGFGTFDPSSVVSCMVHGALYYLPILFVTFLIGGAVEVIFAIVRRHEVNEGFFVTGILFPLVLPATIPLWQVAIGIGLGTLIGKEIFGGTGMNILNPALTSRAFLFFGYPAAISGDHVWIAANTNVDGVSGATWLSQAASGGLHALHAGLTWWDAFVGFIPGSMGETSALACLVGGVFLLITGIASWRIVASVFAGSILTALLFTSVGSATNPFFDVPFYWHLVLGGWAFGTFFMATDPVTAPHSNTGKYYYGFLIGVMVILIRVVNPAYPEGMMMAILFMNLFAAFIDYIVVRANIKRRKARYAA